MSFKSFFGCAVFAAFLMSGSAQAGLIKNAGKSTTSNTTTTTTSGQHSILMTVDPFNITSFQLDVSFEADKVRFDGVITGLNGYIIDTDFNVIIDGSTGLIQDIHGYYPGFNDRTPLTPGLEAAAVPGLPLPPAGEVDIFQLVFTDLRPDLDKTFGVFASSNDYMNGIDPQSGDMTTAQGPVNLDGFGVVPAFSTVPGIPPGGGGSSAPLPAGVLVGLMGGAGVMVKVVRRK